MNLTNLFRNINPKEVIKNLPDAILIVDYDGKIIWANDKASVVFECKIKELKGIELNQIVINGIDFAEKSFSKRNSVVTEALSLNNTRFFVELNAKKYIDQYFITIRDVTAMTSVLEQAEKTGRLNKEKNIMLAKLSNEIKSPLQTIIGFSQAIIDGLTGETNEKQNKYASIINKNSSELLYFMEKLLEFSQVESSLFKCKNKHFDIINTLQTIVKSNEKEINGKNLTINYDFENFNKKAIFSDENYLKTVLKNIFETSVQLTDRGSVTIKLEHPDLGLVYAYHLNADKSKSPESYLKVEISDTGIGLSKTELDGIFEPYTQLDKVHKKAIVRSITLGTAYAIINRMGGVIWVESEVMKGTTFNLIVPIEE